MKRNTLITPGSLKSTPRGRPGVGGKFRTRANVQVTPTEPLHKIRIGGASENSPNVFALKFFLLQKGGNGHSPAFRYPTPSARSRCQTTDYDVQPDQSPAKLWVKNPGGAIRRKERIGVSSASSLRLMRVSGSVVVLPTISAVANANGLESQLLGSAGKASRLATMKLVKFPPARSTAAGSRSWTSLCKKPRS